MASAESAPSQSRVKSTLDSLEQIVKISAGFFAVVYAIGFLVVSVQHGRYGVVMSEFFRARVLAAGLLFAAFVITPIVAASRLFAIFGLGLGGGTRYVNAENLKYAKICGIAQFGVFSWGLATAATPLFSSEYLQGSGSLWWFFVGSGAMLIAFVCDRRWINTSFAMAITVINICAATVFFFALFKWQGHDSAIVTLWFYGVGAGFLLLHFLYSGDSDLMRRTDWEKWVFYSLTLTVIFATSIYTRIKPYWGGGMIPSVTIHFMKSTSFAATIDATGFLIDETDKGFYIAHKANDNSATFVSREQVASIEFVAIK